MYLYFDKETNKYISAKNKSHPHEKYIEIWYADFDSNFTYKLNDNGDVEVDGAFVKSPIPTIEEIFLENLRQHRNQLLLESDWRATVDYPNPDKQAWLDYRQALRDLPATVDPQLDENGQLTNVIWPTPPA